MNIEQFPRVLIISHNALSTVNNMGKTIASYFSAFPRECIAQLYLHEGKPDSNVCNNYYSFSDKDALKSIFWRFYKGNIYKNEDFSQYKYELNDGMLYRLNRKYKPIIYMCRDLVWKFSNIYNKQLLAWIKEFDPDIIFFASGEYSFSYKIALKISKKLNIPLATCFFDDFYFQCQYNNKFLGKFYNRKFLKNFEKSIEYSRCLFVVNNYMAKKYSEHFNKKFYVLYTSCSTEFKKIPYEMKSGLAYIGGLSLGRLEELIVLGEKISLLKDEKINKINVYSFVNDPNILFQLNNSKGIVFQGSVSSQEATTIIERSLACLHIESFKEEFILRTKYSLSTKISDIIGSNTILIAYGPSNIASMKYLIDNNIGIYSDNINELIKQLQEIVTDKEKYYNVINCSKKIAKLNHDFKNVSLGFAAIINNCIKK